ncbi:MAG TPA: RNA-binding protein [Chthoniobacterales bacterium]|jgi:cold-inducible RNA-binding protein|nr:RNA-binding protein [Chthoniobacterales bacterium]
MKLYVGNLAFDSTEADLQELFEQFGTVRETHVITDRETGRSRGFGFVTMGNNAEGEAAIAALHGKQFSGRTLTVNEARPKEDRPRRPVSQSRR